MGLAAFNRLRREQAAKAESTDDQKAPEPVKAEEKPKASKAKAKE